MISARGTGSVPPSSDGPESTSAEFRRLTTARRQRRSQRVRWARVVSTAVGAIGLIALAWFTGLGVHEMPLPALVRTVTGLSLFAGGTHDTDRVARGWVGTIEADTAIVRVSSGLFGLTSIALQVTPETLIVVGDKEGGFGDIRRGELVIASYQLRPGVPEARRVEVFRSTSAEN
jgi:hypothetical protein